MESLKPCQVAVIVTVYNKSPYIRACIESVLVQSHAFVELVVVQLVQKLDHFRGPGIDVLFLLTGEVGGHEGRLRCGTI